MMSITRRKLLSSAGALAGAAMLPLQEEAAQQATSNTLADAVNLFDFEALARPRMSPMAWEYISGGAGDEVTLRWNRESFDRLRLRPRILVDVSHLDTRVKLFGA